jgi:multiple sugar transport system permease protein
MNCWNEFLFAMNLTSVKAVTLPVMAANFITQEAILWGPVTATGTMLMIPMFIFTLLIQKYIVAGLAMGAVK